MSSVLSNYFGNNALSDYFTNATTWLALHTTDPGVGGTLSTEVDGGGYARQSIKWSNASSKTIASTNQQIFTDLEATAVNYIGVWDASVNGHLLFRFSIPTRNIVASGQFIAVAGDIALTL